jgi:exo-beta-1,3-glucanase (GH17 family)
VHPYGGKSSVTQSALGGRIRVTEAYADTHLPVYVTEVGWPTALGQSATGDSLQWTESQQAENITNFVGWARALKYVGSVVYFNYRDYGSNTWYGIESASGTRKLSYNALKAAG